MASSQKVFVVELDNSNTGFQRLLPGEPETCGMKSGRVYLEPGKECGLHSTKENEELLVFLSGNGELLIEENEKDPMNDLEKMVAVYCRVSSHDQKKKGDLERQVKAASEYCTEHEFKNIKTFTDVGSGLNTKRSGLKKMCKLIEEEKIRRVILTYPDRLTRFGFSYLENYFKSHGATIHAINEKMETSMQEELVQDLIAIVTSFSGRVHGMRSHKNKKKKKNEIS